MLVSLPELKTQLLLAVVFSQMGNISTEGALGAAKACCGLLISSIYGYSAILVDAIHTSKTQVFKMHENVASLPLRKGNVARRLIRNQAFLVPKFNQVETHVFKPLLSKHVRNNSAVSTHCAVEHLCSVIVCDKDISIVYVCNTNKPHIGVVQNVLTPFLYKNTVGHVDACKFLKEK